jgi:predicted RecB family nuclease
LSDAGALPFLHRRLQATPLQPFLLAMISLEATSGRLRRREKQSNMTEKERRKLNSKGIFTVKQLSYTFRARRRPKRLVGKREKYHHSLKALAIRERKIHIVGSPELELEGTPVYLDVEGIPDRDFYYLIGIRVKTAEQVIQHSLWADSVDEEKRIWTDFVGILLGIENPVLVHYGGYETLCATLMTICIGIPTMKS